MKPEEHLRELIERNGAPSADAEERAWEVVRSAYLEREPSQQPPRTAWALALAALAAAVVVLATPPGQALSDWVRDELGRERVRQAPTRSELSSLPETGRVLVVTSSAWIVGTDGSKRHLGRYDDASWSPRGLFVVATRGPEVVAMDTRGEVRWALARPEPVAGARWSPSGLRIAYLSGPGAAPDTGTGPVAVRVVAGDGTSDRLVRAAAARVPPAWRPGAGHVLAMADRRGRVRVEAVDERRTLWRSAAGDTPRQLDWSADGRRLVAVGSRSLRVFDGAGRVLGRAVLPGIESVAFARSGHAFALVRERPGGGQHEIAATRAERRSGTRRLFAGWGRISELSWSPDGRWLLASWTGADQWLLIDSARVRRVLTISNVSREFSAGEGRATLPSIAGWCCPP